MQSEIIMQMLNEDTPDKNQEVQKVRPKDSLTERMVSSG